MKKLLHIILGIIKGFFVNPFWKSPSIVAALFFSLAINGVLWYIYEIKIRENPIPFIYASGLIILNLVLANFLWNREKLVSLILIYTILFIQILMLIFVRYLTLVF